MGIMIEKLLAALAMLGLILFTGVILWFVRLPDLFLVIVIPIGIAIYGMVTAFREQADKNKDNGKPAGG
jgi:hypothetical protein